jgi:putative DNA primase/helicase
MSGPDPFNGVRRELDGREAGKGLSPPRSKRGQITPVPSSAPPPPAHPKLGKPSASWAYRDAEGGLLGYVLRFDMPGGKEIRPLTWREGPRGTAWAWEGFDAPRPLYGLDQLAARPSAPVLIVEGEKAADAARVRLPAFVVITWPGGSKSAGKADFAELAGRAVAIWPDADEAGRDAARVVAKAARSAGAGKVGVIELPDTLPKGWDLADPWPADFGATDASAAITGALAAPEPTPRPLSPHAEPEPGPDASGIVWPPGFVMDPASGLWWREGRSGGDGKSARISDPFEVLGEGRDATGKGWSVVLRIKARDGRVSVIVIPRESLASGGDQARRLLADSGLTFANAQGLKEKLASCLMQVGARASGFITLTNETGWHDGRFVLPGETIGAGGERVLFTGDEPTLKYARRGTLEKWRVGVAAKAQRNPLLMFALSCGFAAPLLHPLAAEGGGFHFRGASSSGKSTLLVAAGSIWGGDKKGGPSGFGHPWRATDNAIENLAQAHNDGLLCLDEFAQVDPHAAGAAAYMLANGEGKRRSRPDATARPGARWLLLFLSSGEVGLSDHVASAPKPGRVAAGQELRLLDIAADAGADLGIWKTLDESETPARRSEAIKAAALADYGHAGPLFLERMIASRDARLMEAHSIIFDFEKAAKCAGDAGQIDRTARRFAVVAAAGELAATLGVVPWKPGEAADAAMVVFERWAADFGRVGLREDRQVIARVKAYIEANRAQFAGMGDALDDDEPSAAGRAGEARSMIEIGFRRIVAGERTFLFHTGGFAKVVEGHNPKDAAKALQRAGFLETDAEQGRLTKKISHEGQKRNFYTVKASILAYGDD